MAKRQELSDSEWERIADFFPVSKTGRPPKQDNRTMFNAIMWLARSGSAWEDDILLTKVFTVDFANGERMVPQKLFFTF